MAVTVRSYQRGGRVVRGYVKAAPKFAAGPFDRVAWNRAWRRRNRAYAQAYERARWQRRTRPPERVTALSPPPLVRKPKASVRLRASRKPKAAAIKAVRAMRLEAAAAALASEIATAMALVEAMPELAALVDEQRRDAARYQIKYGPEFLDTGGARAPRGMKPTDIQRALTE